MISLRPPAPKSSQRTRAHKPPQAFWAVRLVLIGLLFGLFAPLTLAQDPLPPALEPFIVQVKFRDGLVVRARDGQLSDNGSGSLAPYAAQLEVLRGRWVRMHQIPEPEIDRLRRDGETNSGTPLPDLNLWFFYYCDEDNTAESAVGVLRPLQCVESVDRVLLPVPPPFPPDLTPSQGYFHAAPRGVGLLATSVLPGGLGAGIRVCDIEYAFNPAHADLPPVVHLGPPALFPPGLAVQSLVDHGTATMGLLVGVNNGFGVTGGCPAATPHFAAAYFQPAPTFLPVWNVAGAITTAGAGLRAGDVILIEQQSANSGGFAPVEINPAIHQAIRTVSAAGRVVIEAAGNGGQDLDGAAFRALPHAPFTWQGASGAVLVGAATAGPTSERLAFSNYGNAVELSAWGQSITTCGYGDAYAAGGPNELMTATFGGTSGASAIVAAATVVLQSRAMVVYQRSLLSADLCRAARLTGTQQSSGAFTFSQCIGARPDVPPALAFANPFVGHVALSCGTTGTTPFNTLQNGLSLPFTTQWESTDGPGACAVSNDTWFTYQASCTGPTTLWLTGSNYNHAFAVYETGQCPTGATPVPLCQTASTRNLGPVARTFNAVAGRSYRVRVGGIAGARGAAIVTLTCTPPPPPPNDLCMGATLLTDSVPAPFSTVGASTDGLSSPCDLKSDVWFVYTAPISGTAEVTLAGHAFSAGIAVSVMPVPCPPTTQVACSGGLSSTAFAALGGRTYLIRVGGVGAQVGTGQILARTLPQNDACAYPQSLSSGITTLNTLNASTDGPASCAVQSDLWYLWTSPCSGVATLSLSHASFPASCAVYRSAVCPGPLSAAEIACVALSGPSAQASFGAAAGESFLIRVGSTTGATGVSDIAIACAPPVIAHDMCSSPLSISTGMTPFDLAGASTDGPIACAVFDDLWFTHVATCDGTLSARVVGAAFTPALAVYSATSCPVTPALACATSQLDVPVLAGHTYLLRVGRSAGVPGPATLAVSCNSPPSNDACTSALTIGNTPLRFETIGATTDGPSSCGALRDVWFRWISPISGECRVRVAGSSFAPIIGAYDSAQCPPTTPLACAAATEIVFPVIAGRAYTVRVGDSGSGGGVARIGATPVLTPAWSGCAQPAWRTSVGGTQPAPRLNSAMVFDPDRNVTLLFGGRTLGGAQFGDTWQWDGAAWTLLANTGPSPRHGHAMVYDSVRRRVLLFGGKTSPAAGALVRDTWEWDGSTWVRVANSGPTARAFGAMAFDSLRGRAVLFGGSSFAGVTWFLNDTWEWDGSTWSLRACAVSPSPRNQTAAAFDADRGVMVLFGGANGASSNVWEWNGAVWTSRAASGPGQRWANSLTFDSQRRSVVCFGGVRGSGCASDLWAWNGSAWTQLTSPGPSARSSHAAAYDPARRALVMFGGGCHTEQSGVWLLETGGDSCLAPLALSLGTTSFDTRCAGGSTEPGACVYGQDIWFRFVAPSSCTLLASVNAPTFAPALSVFAGGDCPAVPPLGCDDSGGGQLSLAVVAGHTYLLRVGALGSGAGGGLLTLACIGPAGEPCGGRADGCPADFNGDGRTDADDIVAYFADFDRADRCADLDDDGEVGPADVAAFFFDWDRGC